jgi:hypothetical protein
LPGLFSCLKLQLKLGLNLGVELSLLVITVG